MSIKYPQQVSLESTPVSVLDARRQNRKYQPFKRPSVYGNNQ